MAPTGNDGDYRASQDSYRDRLKSSNFETVEPVSNSAEKQDGSSSAGKERQERQERQNTRQSSSIGEKEDRLKSSHLTSLPQEEEYKYSPDPDEDIFPNTKRNRLLLFLWLIRYLMIICAVGILLATPAIVYRKDGIYYDDQSPEAQASRNLIFYLFLWFTVSWIGGCIFDVIALAVPYVYRFVIGYVNPAHKKYWRVLRGMRKPITLMGFVAVSFIAFDTYINDNDDLAINHIARNNDTLYWDDALDYILQQVTFWAAAYFLEKGVILYIAVHFHYRAEEARIKQSKRVHNAIVTLYEASIYLYPVGTKGLLEEDNIVQNATGQGKDSLYLGASRFLRKVGIDGIQIMQFFGNLRFENHKSHWIKPGAPYATVERALAHPKHATALAKRIWMSLVMEGSDVLTAEDIAEVLGPYRRTEAQECFAILDENETGSIQLEEFVWTVIEAGRIRRAIYQSMGDMDHCINTFDWVTLIMLATVMTFWILITFVPTLKDLQNTAAALAIGFSFALGRSFHKYLQGCMLVFFEHPFDIGDRVQIYNKNDTTGVSAIVTRQSLLYTVFRRIDNNTTLQIANLILDTRRIENVTRSGANTETRSIFVDFKTTFAEITALQRELEAFLSSEENARHFEPGLNLDVVNIFEMNKLELRVSFTHKSNWSNERLRAARSSRFVCALVAAVRELRVKKPGFLKLGDPDRPVYQVHMRKEDEGSGDAGGSDAVVEEELSEEIVEHRRKAKEAEAAAAAEEEEKAKLEKKEVEDAARRELVSIPELKRKTGREAHSREAGEHVREYIGEMAAGLRRRNGNGGRLGTGAEMMRYPL